MQTSATAEHEASVSKFP